MMSIGGSTVMLLTRFGASELILLGCMACWCCCSAILTTQLAHLANLQHTDAATGFSVTYIVLPFILLLIALSFKQYKEEEDADDEVFVSFPKPPAHPRSVIATTLHVARFAMVVSPFFFLLRPQPPQEALGGVDGDSCTAASVCVALVALMYEGFILICLFVFFPADCYGLLRCLITGVICTSFSKLLALHSTHPYHHYYTASLVLLSLLLMFLCDMYLSLCARQTERKTLPPPTKTPPTADESTMV